MKKRILSLLLCIVLLLGLVPAQTFAAEKPAGVKKPETVATSEGERIPVEDSWEEEYPYGVFLFIEGEANIAEGGEEASIMLYRLGGTQGRASAYVYYNPTTVQLDEDRVSFATAAGCGDVYITVEDTLPIAQYQPIGKLPEPTGKGTVVVATGGTSDIPVAEEAAVTAEALGNRVVRLYDVGVSGIHRLLSHLEEIMSARVIVAVAGMEGALPSVIGGLADCPVIAVPTSVGYGASLGGIAALLSMLNSCASGVSVVNIDNGFGAGYMASMINHLD